MTTSLTVSSTAFTKGNPIPKTYTCDGADRSPPLAISGTPPNAKTLALIVEDPDAPDPAAPKKVWTHWIAYDLPATTQKLDEDAAKQKNGGRLGTNDFGATGYRGPCPPIGRHRYFVKVYALDRELGDLHEPKKADLLKAMEGHIVASGELMGTYQKAK